MSASKAVSKLVDNVAADAAFDDAKATAAPVIPVSFDLNVFKGDWCVSCFMTNEDEAELELGEGPCLTTCEEVGTLKPKLLKPLTVLKAMITNSISIIVDDILTGDVMY